jgi:putative transposase
MASFSRSALLSRSERSPAGCAGRLKIWSRRRDLLDHTIAVDERHLSRLISDDARCHHEDRTHLGLGKETPGRRIHCVATGHIASRDRLGGLHHRYDRAA